MKPSEVLEEVRLMWMPFKKYIEKYNGAFQIIYNEEKNDYLLSIDFGKIQDAIEMAEPHGD